MVCAAAHHHVSDCCCRCVSTLTDHPPLLLHNTSASNMSIFNHQVLRVMSCSGVSVFFRSRPLAEEPQRPDLRDGYRDVSCPCWILCLLDYDHCAAGTLLTIFSQERNLNISLTIKSERKNRKEFSSPRYITVF